MPSKKKGGKASALPASAAYAGLIAFAKISYWKVVDLTQLLHRSTQIPSNCTISTIATMQIIITLNSLIAL